MKNVKLLLLFIFVFGILVMLASPIKALSTIDGRILNNTILYLTEDINSTRDNSTFMNNGTIIDGVWNTQTAKFQVGDKATANDDDIGTMTFTHINAYKTANFSFCLWTNTTTGTNGALISYYDSATAPFWNLKADTGNDNLQFTYRLAGGVEPTIVLQANFLAYVGTLTQ